MSNSLINETSPYLLQHAENPVDWLPWGEAAFERARSGNRPVFLSIGYSSCHWCHVMEKESFEDERVAAVLNAHYVSVKVDREEHPEVDSVYMRVCTALNGSGGWPMTVIMTPERIPFFAATYIPRDDRAGQPGLLSLLTMLAARWERDGESLVKTAGEIKAFISRKTAAGAAPAPGALIDAAAEQLIGSLDSQYGGFGSAPKFPSPQNLLFLLRYAKLSGRKDARAAAELTLKQMYRGGIYDHIGGGFSRYSTDREWFAPHFEKTLYDNALLALCYTEAWQEGHLALWRFVAEGVLGYCLRELLSPDGGFYSSQDADSEGGEGAYYLLTLEQVKSVLGEDEGRHFCECYDITDEGNFNGKSIPNLLLNARYALLPEGYAQYRDALCAYRARRSALATDTKQLCSWNGLMLMALSRAARVFGSDEYLGRAQSLARFLEERMHSGGSLRACLCAGKLRFEGKLDDYVLYALGLLELYDADYEPGHISAAAALANEVLAHFPAEDGGFYMTPDTGESLLIRPMDIYDGALPSGNSAAAVLFDRLWRFTAELKWREERDKQTEFLASHTGKYPAGCAFGLTALLGERYSGREILCAAPDEEIPSSLRAVTAVYDPALTVLLKTPQRAGALEKAAPFTAAAAPVNGKSAFYVCAGGACSKPVTAE